LGKKREEKIKVKEEGTGEEGTEAQREEKINDKRKKIKVKAKRQKA